ncbi:hypothetical protein KORDIASMS9_03250 [Kordia sp. SMS9]|uniref:hypothetical protein n=1 Tax=Kordia sp. SMS9 TaxID=2282170 RepID=UPI000E0DE8EB|nr:hypothetical protein [Kordia sp. SMS9]AXG70995.1 hypothetical protein KORDIASMS9_03250 [Kordia sp. SMS9]
MLNIKRLFTLFCVCAITFSFAQEKVQLKPIDQVDVSQLTKDIQIVKKDKDNFKMVWWIPTEYWKVVMNGSNIVRAEDVDVLTESLDEYILIGSLHAELTQFGDFKPKYQILQLQDSQGNIYKELKKSEISSEYMEMLSSLKPSMTQTLGNFGKQLEFHVFEKTGKDGKLLAPINDYGVLTVLLNGNTSFKFKLPLASMVEEKVCPTDDELLNGNWKFCPWHGKKLKLQTK